MFREILKKTTGDPTLGRGSVKHTGVIHGVSMTDPCCIDGEFGVVIHGTIEGVTVTDPYRIRGVSGTWTTTIHMGIRP